MASSICAKNELLIAHKIASYCKPAYPLMLNTDIKQEFIPETRVFMEELQGLGQIILNNSA